MFTLMKCVRKLFFNQKYSLEVIRHLLAGGVGGPKVKNTGKFRCIIVQARTAGVSWGYYRSVL